MPLFERVIAYAVIGFLVWQVAIPVLFGLPAFPLFRRKAMEKKMLTDIAEAKRDLMIDELRSELEALRQRHEAARKTEDEKGKDGKE